MTGPWPAGLVACHRHRHRLRLRAVPMPARGYHRPTPCSALRAWRRPSATWADNPMRPDPARARSCLAGHWPTSPPGARRCAHASGPGHPGHHHRAGQGPAAAGQCSGALRACGQRLANRRPAKPARRGRPAPSPPPARRAKTRGHRPTRSSSSLPPPSTPAPGLCCRRASTQRASTALCVVGRQPLRPVGQPIRGGDQLLSRCTMRNGISTVSAGRRWPF